MPFVSVESRAIRFWRPNKRQEDFIRVPDSVREGLFGGAAGGGKSDVLLALPVLKDWIQQSWFFGCLFRQTVPQLEESLIPRAKEMYKPLGARFNENKNEFTFPSGARIKLDYLDSEDDARSKDTVEYNYAGFDELTHLLEFCYKYIVYSRLRGDVRVARAGTNPGNRGHVWVRDHFVVPAPGGYKYIKNKEGLIRIFIPSLVTDNDWLMEHDPDYVKALMSLPEAEKRAKLYGDWFSFLGQVFAEFRTQPYQDEPPNAKHVIEPFDIPYWWPKVAAIDWGHQAYTWIGWAAISPDNRAFQYREFHEKGLLVSDWANQFKLLSMNENIKSIAIDPSSKTKRGDPKSILKQFVEHSGYRPRLADNDRLSGKMLIHEYLRWKPKTRYIPPEGYNEERYWRIYRAVGEKAANSYRSVFEPEPEETNLPKLQIFGRYCPAVVKALPLARYDEKNVEDVAEWDPTENSPGDDPYDGERYLLKEIDRYIKDEVNKESPTHEIDEAIKRLEETDDQTSFHIHMATIEERRKTEGRRSILRRHSRHRRFRLSH